MNNTFLPDPGDKKMFDSDKVDTVELLHCDVGETSYKHIVSRKR